MTYSLYMCVYACMSVCLCVHRHACLLQHACGKQNNFCELFFSFYLVEAGSLLFLCIIQANWFFSFWMILLPLHPILL